MPSLPQLPFEVPFTPTSDISYEEQISEPDLINTSVVPGFSPDPRFNDNLVKYIARGELERIGSNLSECIQGDDRDRQKWLRVVREGIEYLGIGAERAPSTQSSKDTDLYAATFLTECLKISCKLFSLFFPGRKFAKTQIYGLSSDELEDKTFSTSEYFDYYTNDVMTDYIPSAEQAIWWSVLGGCSFVKPYFDPQKGRIVAPYIPPHDVIISSGASSINEAERVTHRFILTKRQMEENFFNGTWIKSSRVEENSNYTDPVQRKVNQVTGMDPLPNEDNQNYRFDECFTYLRISGFEEIDMNGMPTPRYIPYRVVKDANSNVIVGIWRNWNEKDVLFRPKIGIVQHKYFAGFGPYGLGMIHLALGLAKTETKIQQQLLKGAVLSNMPNLIQKAGLRTERSQLNFTPGVIPQVTTFGADLKDAFMPMPFSPPSPVMMDMVNYCAGKIEGISMAREIKADNIPANTSATTILGILTTSNDIPNSLIKSYYRSFAQEFQLIYNLLGEILPEEPYPFAVPGGEQRITKHDFSPSIQMKPMLDPDNSSQTVQMLTNEVIMQLAKDSPDLYDQRAVQKMILKSLKVQDIDKVLVPDPAENPPPPPAEMDPVSENMFVMQGQPIKAYKDQDHAAHMTIHKAEINKLLQEQEADQSGNTDNSTQVAALNAHNIEHEVYEYQLRISNAIGMDIPDDPTQIPPDVQNEIALRAAQSADQTHQAQQAAAPAEMDPSIPLMEENRVKEKGIELEAQSRHEQHILEEKKLESQTELEHLRIQLEFKRLEIEERKLILQEKQNDNKTEVDLTKLHLEQQKADLQVQSKAFGDTLKYENDAALKDRQIEADKEKQALEAKSKAFDTVMAHEREKDSQENKAKGEKNGTTNG